MCHALLQNTKFLQLLLKMDTELAAQARAGGCRCGGYLHRGNYPRKPRCCPDEVYGDFDWRYSFSCNRCRKRTTPVSVRFLGRRVYLGLAVVLMSAGRTEATSAVANLSGDTGSSKSVILRLLAERLKKLPDITVGAINHPQSNLADFYRELGDIFSVPLRPSNRWGGFKALHERWLTHLESSRCRPVLLIDDAQDTKNFCPGTRMTIQVLSELRLLASARFDSQSLLCIVMAGDARINEKLRREELIPLGSRIRTRLATEFASRDELLACLNQTPA